MAKKFLDDVGLSYLVGKIKDLISVKADSDHSHDAATTSAAGFMSASDKTKLNGIATGANKTTVDTALSSSSTNPVQNKVVNAALEGKAASDHNHDSSYLKKTGGTLTGALSIEASSAKMMLKNPNANGRSFYTQQWADGSVDIRSQSSGQDYASLRVLDESSGGVNFLRAMRQVDGQPENYIILHSGNVGDHAVPATRKVNNKALSGDITLSASDVKALPSAGGTITGNLKISKSNSPEIEMVVSGDNGYTSMYQHGGTLNISSGMSDGSDDAFVVLTKPGSDLSNLFRIGTTIGGSTKRYKLYGEHNKPKPADIGAATQPSFVAATMAASGWSDNTYSFEGTYPKDSYDIAIEVAPTATTEQFEAFGEAMICGSATENVATALNGAPMVDIPIIVKVVAK